MTNLFDFQRFQRNKKLDNLIRQSEARYSNALADDELDMVNAAGEVDLIGKKDKDILMKELKEDDQ